MQTQERINIYSPMKFTVAGEQPEFGPEFDRENIALIRRIRSGTELDKAPGDYFLGGSGGERLVVKWQTKDAHLALEELMERNDRLCIWYVFRFLGERDIPVTTELFEELTPTARLGMIVAAYHYDPHYGEKNGTYRTKFSSYAVHAMQSHLSDFLLGKLMTYSMTYYEAERFRAVRKYTDEHRGNLPDLKTIAADLHMQTSSVLDALTPMKEPVELDGPVFDEDGDCTLGDLIADRTLSEISEMITDVPRDLPEFVRYVTDIWKTRINKYGQPLSSERNLDIFLQYYMDGVTQEALAKEKHVSKERIKQILQTEKLKFIRLVHELGGKDFFPGIIV